MVPTRANHHLWIANSPLENITLKSIHVMSTLLLQKPSKNSKAKDHVVALERRLKFSENGNITGLGKEGESIQERLPTGERSKNIAKVSFKCKKKKIQKSNVKGTLTNLFPMHPPPPPPPPRPPPRNRKPYGFLMFSGSRERCIGKERVKT